MIVVTISAIYRAVACIRDSQLFGSYMLVRQLFLELARLSDRLTSTKVDLYFFLNVYFRKCFITI